MEDFITRDLIKKHLPELNKKIENATYGMGYVDVFFSGNICWFYSSDSWSEVIKDIFKKWLLDLGIRREDCEGSLWIDDWNIHWNCVVWGVFGDAEQPEEEWIEHQPQFVCGMEVV